MLPSGDLNIASKLGESEELTLSSRESELVRRIAEMEREMSMAASLQEAVMTPNLKAWDGLSFGYKTRAASAVSGDYVEIFRRQREVFMLCADVCGHGVSAALISMAARQAFLTSIHPDFSPAQILRAVHTSLRRRLRETDFLSAFLVKIDHKNQVTYSSAGHPPAILYRAASHTLEYLSTNGGLVGLINDEEGLFYDATTDLRPGDKLILYTDGLMECLRQDGERMDEVLFEEQLLTSCTLPVNEIPSTLLSAMQGLVGHTKNTDDISILCTSLTPDWDEFIKSVHQGTRSLQDGDPARALVHFTGAKHLLKSFPRLDYLLARTYATLGDYFRATSILKILMEEHPTNGLAARLNTRVKRIQNRLED